MLIIKTLIQLLGRGFMEKMSCNPTWMLDQEFQNNFWILEKLRSFPVTIITESNMILLTDKSFNKERNGDDVEYKEIENILSVLLKECCETIPVLFQPAAVLVKRWIEMETCHSARIVIIILINVLQQLSQQGLILISLLAQKVHLIMR